jgi:CheY-like chemotaxis protein
MGAPGGNMEARHKRVLIFDDDYESMRTLKEYIESEGDWAIELSAERSLLARLACERFDLIVLDLMIHRTSLDDQERAVQNVHFEGVNWRETGLEFLRRLRAGAFRGPDDRGTPPDVPVIILSAVADESIRESLSGGDATVVYAEKPFRLDVVIDLMAEQVGT